MTEDYRRALSSLDTSELQNFGIRCQNFSGSEDNIILVSDGMVSQRGLEINFSGARNEIDLRGLQLPGGRLSVLGDEGSVLIDTDSEVFIDAYVYKRARLLIQKPRAIFGLWSSITENTSLSIGSGALFAEGVKIFTSDHHSVIDLNTGKQINFPGDVTIENDVWIASDVTILKNSTIGKGSVVGARAVVTGSIPSMELWSGHPARCLKQHVSWVPSHPAEPAQIEHMMAGLNLLSN